LCPYKGGQRCCWAGRVLPWRETVRSL